MICRDEWLRVRTGCGSVQLDAVCDEGRGKRYESGVFSLRRVGTRSGQWVLLCYFFPEGRYFLLKRGRGARMGNKYQFQALGLW